ncbi:DUF6542 domain-containing protein [Corynebacterium sp. A21]|uniref:DUF6542 domain-containing protein n=1 Tax=Corynebacterium sp. A21 TaxID=3457318 RepID=UPI003FCEFEF6
MSNVPPQTRKPRAGSARPAAGTFPGLPAWSGIAIVFAALVTGLVISVAMGTIGAGYLACFAIAGIAVALLVELRGLFLTVAALPLLFSLVTPVASWFVSQTLTGSNAEFSATAVVTSIFPLLQFFPLLFTVTLGSAAIALLRLWLFNRRERERERSARSARRRDAEAERVNRATAHRARQTSTRIPRQPRAERTGERVTVEELMQRNVDRDNRSISDDLYRD